MSAPSPNFFVNVIQLFLTGSTAHQGVKQRDQGPFCWEQVIRKSRLKYLKYWMDYHQTLCNFSYHMKYLDTYWMDWHVLAFSSK